MRALNYIPIFVLLALSMLLLKPVSVQAQQYPMLSQYMFNKLLINPAYAGSREVVSTSVLYRNQWAGFDGAPKTESAGIHGLLKNKKVGLGMQIANDKIGITNQTDVYGNYAYHLPMQEGKLAMGMRFGLSFVNSNLSDLNVADQGDQVYELTTQNNILPNFGFGLYYYQTKFYAGLSIPYLLDYDPLKDFSFEEKENLHKLTRHYFIHSGYVFDFSREFKLKPSMLLKYVSGSPVQVDINVNALLSEVLWIGASYRSGDAILGIVEFQVSNKLRVGYAYDYSLTDIRSVNSGSHEIMLGYDFSKNILKVKNPRYF